MILVSQGTMAADADQLIRPADRRIRAEHSSIFRGRPDFGLRIVDQHSPVKSSDWNPADVGNYRPEFEVTFPSDAPPIDRVAGSGHLVEARLVFERCFAGGRPRAVSGLPIVAVPPRRPVALEGWELVSRLTPVLGKALLLLIDVTILLRASWLELHSEVDRQPDRRTAEPVLSPRP